MSVVVKNNNLDKILDPANYFEENEIFILNISTVVKNDSFEQNPRSGQHFLTNLNFHP